MEQLHCPLHQLTALPAASAEVAGAAARAGVPAVRSCTSGGRTPAVQARRARRAGEETRGVTAQSCS